MKCDACSEGLDFQVLIPSEVWELIANGRYALCPRCIDAECAALGLKNIPCEPMFNGNALTSELAPEFLRAALHFRPSPACVARDGKVGNPRLFTGEDLNGRRFR